MTALGVVALLSSTMANRVGLGDAPEAIAGGRVAGVLHAPGYVVYALAARIFTVVPVGDFAWRVDLFSAACTVAMAVLVYALGRRLGASPPASVIGALAVCSGTSVWFYAGYAKHYPFSASLVLGALVLLVDWRATGGTRRPILAGVCMGLAFGAAWEFAAVAVPALAIVTLRDRTKVWAREIGAGVGALILVGMLVAGYTMVRANQGPAVNWGEASTPGRVIRLASMQDFGFGAGTLTLGSSRRASNQAQKKVGPVDLVLLPTRIGPLGVLATRELGLGGLLLALWGAGVGYRRAQRTPYLAVVVLAGTTFAAVPLVAGPGHIPTGFEANLRAGGFYELAWAMMGVLLAVGVDDLAGRAERRAGAGSERAPAMILAVTTVLGAAVVVPSIVTHFPVVNRHGPDLGVEFADTVLSELPPGAAVVMSGSERAYPLVEAQVVRARRPDVLVLAFDPLNTEWYRAQIRRRVGVTVVKERRRAETAAGLVQQLRSTRPVYLDASLAQTMSGSLAYRTAGLVAQVVDGVGAQRIDPDPVAVQLDSAPSDGIYRGQQRKRFPNGYVLDLYATAHLELAGQYDAAGRRSEERRQLQLVLAVEPRNPAALQDLNAIGQ